MKHPPSDGLPGEGARLNLGSVGLVTMLRNTLASSSAAGPAAGSERNIAAADCNSSPASPMSTSSSRGHV